MDIQHSNKTQALSKDNLTVFNTFTDINCRAKLHTEMKKIKNKKFFFIIHSLSEMF